MFTITKNYKGKGPQQKETNRINSEQMKQFELIKEDGRRKSKSTKL